MTAPAILTRTLRPIDAHARDGRCRMVVSEGRRWFAVARWDGGRWVYPGSAHVVEFEPVEYQA